MKKSKIIEPQQVEVGSLLSILGDSILRDMSKALNSDKWVIKLGTVTVFKLALYSILESDRLSLRTMAENYLSVPFQVLEQSVIGDKTAHSSIRDRLVKIDVRFFEKIYERSRQLLREHYGEGELSKQYDLKRYDSTMIGVFSHLLEGMKVGNTSKKKNQVKLTTELVGDFEVRMRFFKDQDHLGEEVALKEMIQSQSHTKDSLIVFDRGLKSRQTFCELKGLKTRFVTRLNERNRYKFLRAHAEVLPGTVEGLNFVGDSIVHLYGDGTKLVKEEFRLIEAIVVKTGKKIFFLTNVLTMGASEIAQVYRQRWDIEVFFRFLKQEMNLTHFVCNNINAIQVMIYCTLIAAMLVLVFKKLNGINSYKNAKTRFVKELVATISLEFIEEPGGFDRFKEMLTRYVKKNRQNTS
jgi:Transposase DDE domain